jgi:hypothetical protein
MTKNRGWVRADSLTTEDDVLAFDYPETKILSDSTK